MPVSCPGIAGRPIDGGVTGWLSGVDGSTGKGVPIAPSGIVVAIVASSSALEVESDDPYGVTYAR